MKRSLIVFVALGLMAGLVGCGGSTDPLSDPLSEAETEARQWLIDVTTENVKSVFEELDITSVSAEEHATCYLKALTERNPRFGDSNYWQQQKELYIDKPNSYWFEGEIGSDENYAFFICGGGDGKKNRLPLKRLEHERIFAFYLDSKYPHRSDNNTVNKPVTTPEPTRTVSQQQAEQSAEDYLNYSAFSRSGLIDQLEYEGFSTTDATYGVDAQNANWNAQAALMAQEYLDYSSFSRTGLIDQLIFEGFTRAQATYGVNAVGL